MYTINSAYPPANFFSGKSRTYPFPKFLAAMNKVRSDTANAKILCIGDSTTNGQGDSTAGTIPNTHSYPAVLSQDLNSRIASSYGLAIPTSIIAGLGNVHDDRWSLGADWDNNSSFGMASGAVYRGLGGSTNLTFTPDGGFTINTFDIYYLSSGGLGTINISESGGASTIINSNAASAVRKSTLTTTIPGSSLVLTMTDTAGTVFIVGVDRYSSTTKKVLVGNAGVGGSNSNSWIQDLTFGGVPFITTYAPDLTIISLGINDATTSVDANTYAINIQTLITAAKLSGDVILMSMPPSSGGAPYSTFEPQYVAKLALLAASNNCYFIDTFTMFGGVWNATFMNDQFHPNDLGYQTIAGYINNIL